MTRLQTGISYLKLLGQNTVDHGNTSCSSVLKSLLPVQVCPIAHVCC